MKKIAIIGASELQNPLILKAKEMGYETHVFAWECGDIGEKTADYFYPISITEKEKILEKCKKINVDAVCTIASDLGNVVAGFVARQMGLPANSEYCIKVSSNKYEMRKAFVEHNIAVPRFVEITNNDSLDLLGEIQYPVIVKPTDRSGSRGITKLDSPKGLDDAVKKAIELSFEKKAIVEEYIDGNEYSMECISFEGEHKMLAVTKKYTTGAPHFIETGHMEPSDLNEQTIEKAKEEISKALDALDIQMGVSHSEFKVDNEGNIKIIEIGSRMGGDCIGSDLVRLSTGYDCTKMAIQTALGEKPHFEKVKEPSNAAVKYIFSKGDYDNYLELKKSNPEIVKYSSEILVDESDIVDSSSRFGFYIIESKDRDLVKGVMEQNG
ncbi:MAG: ATP-grasp domain-containing protein [Lachnospiraceae bacterium]|nr:ATP-grasp domain-containing protein [Lachnospiraceae bacterium]